MRSRRGRYRARSTETLLPSPLVVTTSGLPSRFRSPTATFQGPRPTATAALLRRKLPRPSPDRMETEAGAVPTTRSIRPSPSKSAAPVFHVRPPMFVFRDAANELRADGIADGEQEHQKDRRLEWLRDGDPDLPDDDTSQQRRRDDQDHRQRDLGDDERAGESTARRS